MQKDNLKRCAVHKHKKPAQRRCSFVGAMRPETVRAHRYAQAADEVVEES